jgi:hypothetical protein
MPLKTPWRLITLLLLALGLAACAPMRAQNPGQGLSPVRAEPGPAGESLMLGGADVVAYFTQGRHAQGLPEHQSVHRGVSFRFTSAEHRALFEADPARYLPQYNGYCANGVAYAIPWGGSPESFLIVQGRLYIFGGDTSRASFELDLKNQIALADRYWKDEIEGRNSFWQRTKRLVWRVPHYASDAELAARVAAARAASAPR